MNILINADIANPNVTGTRETSSQNRQNASNRMLCTYAFPNAHLRTPCPLLIQSLVAIRLVLEARGRRPFIWSTRRAGNQSFFTERLISSMNP
jgi:hypothetical protein